MKKTILVVGGAGYIGSHTAYTLYQHGYAVVILDALLHGQSFDHPWADFVYGDFGNSSLLHEIFKKYQIDSVMHFAAHIEVGESVIHPLKFYQNNISNTITLLNVMRHYQCNNIIFSSSCAVYGKPQYTPMDEHHPKNPISPYGRTKLITEQILDDCAHAYGLRYIALRYFNAAGAWHEQGLGEYHNPETHLIPLLCRAASEHTMFTIFGIDHNTPDGSCMRDFLHVRDIATAHLNALYYLHANNPSTSINLGTGRGTSVLEMISIIEQITHRKIMLKHANARAGDPAILVAQASHAHAVLHWQPQYSDLSTIVQDTIASHMYHSKNPDLHPQRIHPE